ncbi:MAG: hypothetical protein J6Y19_09595 [Kiritimatiellae bacterium]|nr:hypothetical protein [Kiritimatiellia bacterium]
MTVLRHNYYFSSFFWSTVSRLLAAAFGFITTPLLLGFYGKADYGILALATACNGYMHLLDLGMNIGAVKYFAQWAAEGRRDLVQRVANTNQTFYLIISAINIIALLALAIWGAPLFNITAEQFTTLRECLIIIALFSVFSWGGTPFNQLLIADKQMAFTAQMHTLMSALKFLLIGLTLYLKLPLTTYFFFLTALSAILIIPYAIRCRQSGLIRSFSPRTCWHEFRPVLGFSLAIFALSLFQATATQSRPILLGMFASDGAAAVAEFNIVQVVPNFIIMLAGTFTGIFLPQTSRLVAAHDQSAIEQFAYKWTRLTSVVVNVLCFPFILGARSALAAYVGPPFAGLSVWLVVWILTVLVQMHTTAGNALVLAYGRTKVLVIMTACACLLSMLLNILLCRFFQVGSAIVAYFLYVLFIIGMYYCIFYQSLLHLRRRKMLAAFLHPLLMALLAWAICLAIPIDNLFFWEGNRFYHLAILALKSCAWFVPYVLLLFAFKVVTIAELTHANNQ